MHRRDRAGFTLLEAMIAVTIVGLAGVAALQALGTELRTADRARRALEAEALAAERVSAVRLLPADALVPLADTLARGRWAAPLDAYSWTATVRRVRDHADLYDVAVRVEWDAGAYETATRLWRPAPDSLP